LVEVEKASTRGRVSLIEGSFLLGDKRYRFSGIVVMTLGGPSVGISLAEKSEEELSDQRPKRVGWAGSRPPLV
jgi:hypothetical protein